MTKHSEQPIEPLLRQAKLLHRAGQRAEAGALYAQVLKSKPDHSDALFFYGVLLLEMNRVSQAIDLLRQCLKAQPNHVTAGLQLAKAYHQQNSLQEALKVLKRVVALAPQSAVAYGMMGSVWRDAGELNQAIAAHRQAVALQPNDAVAHYNLGNCLAETSEPTSALHAYAQAITLNPRFYQAYAAQGRLLCQLQQVEQALVAIEKAVALAPQSAAVLSDYSFVLNASRQYAQSVEVCRRALQCLPDHAPAYLNLGQALAHLGDYPAAQQAFERAAKLQPNDAVPPSNLSYVLKELGQWDAAVQHGHKAIALNPTLPEASYNLGNALKYQGRLDDALSAYRQAIELRPMFPEAHSNLVYLAHFHPAFDTAAQVRELQQWNQLHARPVWSRRTPPTIRDQQEHRRLRVGYVSPDFYNQAESFFTIPLLAHHDHEQFEIHAYSSVQRPDHITDRLRRYCDVWHEVNHCNDEQLAQQIRHDQIDVLVDLTMHMGRHRALVFAREPAPVQVCWLAYPGSTGLDAMHYRITDAIIDPLEQADPHFNETPIRLPHGWVAYDPLGDYPLSTTTPTGPITFGSLNNPVKHHDALLDLWIKVLESVPDSRLLLLVFSREHRERILQRMAHSNIAQTRIQFADRMDRPTYMHTYERIDLALDPLPYNGITTTCDALYMGTPVLCMLGNTPAGRAGASILKTVGLEPYIAANPQAFIESAVTLAEQAVQQRGQRLALRRKMQQSPLMDGPRFARDMEAAYRQMWRTTLARYNHSS